MRPAGGRVLQVVRYGPPFFGGRVVTGGRSGILVDEADGGALEIVLEVM